MQNFNFKFHLPKFSIFQHRYVGVDIRTTSIKVAVIKKGSDVSFFSLNNVKDFEDFVKRENIHEVITNLSGRHVISRAYEFPVSSEEEIMEMILSDKEKYLPPGEDFIFNTYILERDETRSYVLITSVKESILKKHIELLESLQLIPLYVGASSLSLINPFIYHPWISEGVTSVINIEEKTVEVIIVKNGIFSLAYQFSRENDIILRIKDIFNFHKDPVEKILLVGSSVKNNFLSRFESDFGIEVETPEKPEYTLALGLALKGIYHQFDPVDLLPKSIRKKIVEKKEFQFFKKLSFGILAIFILIFTTLGILNSYFSIELKNLKENKGLIVDEINVMMKDYEIMKEKVNLFERLSLRKIQWDRVLYEIGKANTEGLWLSAISAEKGEIVISGLSMGEENVAQYIQKLSNSFRNVSLKFLKKKDDLFSFSITLSKPLF